MLQHQRELLHARAATAQKTFELEQQTAQRKQQCFGFARLRGQFQPRSETCRRHESLARIGPPTQGMIEGGHDVVTEAPGQPIARQCQAIGNGAYAQFRQQGLRFRRPIEQGK